MAENSTPMDVQKITVTVSKALLTRLDERVLPRQRSHYIAEAIEERTGFETRVTVLGHVQRGGTPTAFDRVLTTRFGVEAITAVHDGDFGCMVALQAGDIVRVPLAEAVTDLKTVDPRLVEVAELFFG